MAQSFYKDAMLTRVRGAAARSVVADLLVLPMAVGEVAAAARTLGGGRAGAALRRAVAATRFRGRDGDVASVPFRDTRAGTLCLIGLGEPRDLDVDAWRRAGGRARTAAERLGAARVAIAPAKDAGDVIHLVALREGFALAGYRFTKYRSNGDAPRPIRELTLLAPDPPPSRVLTATWKTSDLVLDAVATVRDLVNEPAAVKTPRFLADAAQRLARAARIEVEVWDLKRIRAERLAGLLAVARGSREEPRFLRLHYRGAKAARRIALVGKGITFDSGGLSLKPAKSMETMKIDMAGGAVVVAVMCALGRLRPALEVEGFVPISENLPGGTAQKPGDVIRYANGKTVEVLNTDAEGRLVLADALILAAAAEPDAIIDLATLTGACIVALGHEVAGLFGNDQTLVDQLIGAGRDSGEALWQLPLVPEYRDDLKSAVADLKNIGGGHAGSITAALFLQEFVSGVPWAHLDIAGPAFAASDRAYCPRGGTGFGVRTMLRYLLAVAADPTRLGRARAEPTPSPSARASTRR